MAVAGGHDGCYTVEVSQTENISGRGKSFRAQHCPATAMLTRILLLASEADGLWWARQIGPAANKHVYEHE